MSEPPYSEVAGDELILRDVLALDRTMLANERTLLAYLRTGFGLVVVGVTFLQFFENQWFSLAGIGSVLAGAVTCGVGWRRFRFVQHRLDALRHRSGVPAPGPPGEDQIVD